MPFDTFDEAVRIVNSSDYGLTSAVYTQSMMTANRATRAIDAGLVFVNNYNRAMLGTPCELDEFSHFFTLLTGPSWRRQTLRLWEGALH